MPQKTINSFNNKLGVTFFFNYFQNSKDSPYDNIINYYNFKKGKLDTSTSKNKTISKKAFIKDKGNSTLSSKSQIIKRKQPNTLRDKRKIEDILPPKEITEAEINNALEMKMLAKVFKSVLSE